MRTKFTIALFLLNFIGAGLYAQQPPLVYPVENSGKNCPAPALFPLNQLPTIAPLPDPFMWSDGSGRSTSFNNWECRRNEIRSEIEHYEIGKKPEKPDTITASFANNTLTVNVTKNGQTLVLTSQIVLPAGTGPFPAVIGMNSGTGSIPADVFTSRNIATIRYNHNNVTTYNNPQLTDPYYKLYPDQNLDNAGQYSAWAWGVSRIIDGLELVKESLPIDLSHLGVTGCSYAGKMALFAGAFDERIALTIAQESGGGGAPAWRVSETIGDVEKLGATSHQWFKESMFEFAGPNVSKLPHDHHELMAMIAPRALLVTGNTDFLWLANPSCYVSARAAHEVWKTFGIGDRFGYYIDGGHGHCAIPATQRPAVEAFVDKFMLGKTDVNTNIMVHPYPGVDYESWYKWWGTNNPTFPPDNSKKIWLEAECATVGSSWDILDDAAASKGKYVMGRPGLNSTATAPAGDSSVVTFSFYVDSAATYNFQARVNCANANDDSYWIKIDNGTFTTINNLTTAGWQWVTLTTSPLSVGQHTFTIAYREDGAKLDKILVTTSGFGVNGIGSPGVNCGAAPVITPNQSFGLTEKAANGFSIGQITATDIDTDTTLQKWTVTGGTGIAFFSVDPVNGEITLTDNSSLDFESANRSFTLNITVSDGYFTSNEETVTINLTNANDNAPVITNGISFVLDGGTCNELGAIAAIDADDTNEPGFTIFQNWQIAGGTGKDIFAINPSTGVVSIADLGLADMTRNSYTLQVTVSDGANISTKQTVTVSIPDKIRICHNGNIISVSKLAAIAHIRHGDCIRSCGTGVDYPALKVTANPNPGVNTFLVTIKGGHPTQPVTMKVYNILGRLIEQKQNLQSGQSFRIGQDYQAGIYAVEFSQGLDKEVLLLLKLK